MTVGELIKELSKHPKEMEVLNYDGYNINSVEEEKGLYGTNKTFVVISFKR